MLNNKKDMIIMTVGSVLLLLVSAGLIVAMFAPFENVGALGNGEGVYTVDLKMLGATETNKSYEIKSGDTLTLKVKADEGYILPESVSVSNCEYTWTKSSYSEGVLVLSQASDDIDVTISAFDSVPFNMNWTNMDYAVDVNSDNSFMQRSRISLSGGKITLALGSSYTIGSIDCDEEITATWTSDSDGVHTVTVTYSGDIPEDGTVNIFFNIVEVNAVSLSLENCSAEEVIG